ncbi:MAG: hypothetical protein QOH14_3921 [Pseudonocardiales bacterium]|jgi:hypothetical protein|nr:hypothetical protein [Pseudonocardiales bacterium]
MQLIGEDLALSHLGESMFARFNVVLTLSAQFIVPSIFATGVYRILDSAVLVVEAAEDGA